MNSKERTIDLLRLIHACVDVAAKKLEDLNCDDYVMWDKIEKHILVAVVTTGKEIQECSAIIAEHDPNKT